MLIPEKDVLCCGSMLYYYGMAVHDRGVESISELLGKGLIADARAIARSLERESSLPASLQPRLKMMANDLMGALVEAQNQPLSNLGAALAPAARRLVHVLVSIDPETLLARDEVRAAMLSVAQAFELYAEGSGVWESLDVPQLLKWLDGRVEVTNQELASWLGHDPTSLYRWKTGKSVADAEAETRLRSLCQLVTYLCRAYTPRGVRQWLERPLPTLADRSPLQSLGDALAINEAAPLAARSLGM
jgi:hypothetical protein